MSNNLSIEWKHLKQVLEEYGDWFIARYRENLSNGNHNATSTLSNTIEKIVEVGDDKFSVSVSLEDYWVYLDKGTRPHWCPIQPLIDWVQVKGIVPRAMSNGRVPTVSQLAHMVQHKIAKEGTPATNTFTDAKQATYEHFEEAIALAIQEDVDEWVTNTLVWYADMLSGKKIS